MFRRRPTAVALTALLLGALPAAPAAADHRDGWDDEADATAPYYDDGWTPPSDDVASGEDAVPPSDDGFSDDGTPTAGGDAGIPAVPLPAAGVPPVPALAPALMPIPPTRVIPGTVARLRTDGKAAIPRGAPKRVQALIAAANRITGKPYKWGGGHARLADTGYDCSGAVSFALRGGGLLAGSMVSGALAHWQSSGAGRWVTVYANKGHVYLEVAGLRLDTSAVGDPAGREGVRWRPPIGKRRGFSVRHPAGL